MDAPALLIRTARERAGLSQRELASRAGTSQPAIARAESGQASITVATLQRLLRAAGFDLEMTARPHAQEDPVTAAYRQGVDRTLLEENRKKTVEERLRAGAEAAADLGELERATRAARARPGGRR